MWYSSYTWANNLLQKSIQKKKWKGVSKKKKSEKDNMAYAMDVYNLSFNVSPILIQPEKPLKIPNKIRKGWNSPLAQDQKTQYMAIP